MEPRGSGSAVRGGCPGRERERSRLRARSAGMETLREGTGTRSRPAKPRGMEGAASPAPPGEVSVCLSVCPSLRQAQRLPARQRCPRHEDSCGMEAQRVINPNPG